jgi:hypothetical protein
VARPSLERNVKFKSAVRRLNVPKPYVRGLLETMWDVANECGNPVLGTADDVEAAAEWPGESGKLFEVLRDLKLIDDRRDGTWEIHDYWDHAPEYVKGRYRKEMQRKRARLVTGQSQDGRGTVTQTADTPAPAPAPINTPTPFSSGPDNQFAAFEAFWERYPKKVAKPAAQRAWITLDLSAEARADVMAGLKRWKCSKQWADDGGKYVPNAANWINDRRWEDEVPLAVPPAVRANALTDEQITREREQHKQEVRDVEARAKVGKLRGIKDRLKEKAGLNGTAKRATRPKRARR